MNKFDNLKEIMAESQEIFEGYILHVYKDKVKLPNDQFSERELIRHVGAVCMIPITEDLEVVVERQYRYPMDEVITEIPAGKLDSKQEDRLEAAKRELLEETGITADEWVDLGNYYPAAAYSDERITMYMARGLHYGEQRLDADEFLNVEKIRLEDLVEDVMSGKIPDGKTQLAVLKAAKLLGKL